MPVMMCARCDAVRIADEAVCRFCRCYAWQMNPNEGEIRVIAHQLKLRHFAKRRMEKTSHHDQWQTPEHG